MLSITEAHPELGSGTVSDKTDALRRWAETRGYQVGFGPAQLVTEAREAIGARRRSGELAEGLYHAELAAFVEGKPPGAGATVVVVAKPRSASRVSFELEDGCFDAVLPPTYARYRATFEDVRQDLATHGLPGAHLELLTGPLKAVAARLGLVRYGRNNLTYAPGAGSYIQLCGYVTDVRLAPVELEAAGPRFLDQCEGCSACRRACPTRAIDAERMLLRAERCLTFVNENPGEWPDWVPSRAHRCLIGCLLCQRACPANPKLTVEETGLCFSASETRALLDSDPVGDRREETGIRAKLAWLGQPYAEPVLGRNLRALLKTRRRAWPE
jgi:epoxyqueuosine reductase